MALIFPKGFLGARVRGAVVGRVPEPENGFGKEMIFYGNTPGPAIIWPTQKVGLYF
jgi:hypothetical protein